MEAGEAVWRLYAILTRIQRRGNAGQIRLSQEGMKSLDAIAAFVSVPPPTEEQLAPIIAQYDGTEGAPPSAPRTSDAPRQSSAPSSGEVKEVIELCDKILEFCDEPPEKAEDYAEGVKVKALSVKEFCKSKNFVSPKQRAMIENIWNGCMKWKGNRDD